MAEARSVATVQPEGPRDTKAPPAVKGGTEYIESLGRWIDNLMGDERARGAADRALESLTMSADDGPEDPPPSYPAPPVQGGTEVITKGGNPGNETR